MDCRSADSKCRRQGFRACTMSTHAVPRTPAEPKENSGGVVAGECSDDEEGSGAVPRVG